MCRHARQLEEAESNDFVKLQEMPLKMRCSKRKDMNAVISLRGLSSPAAPQLAFGGVGRQQLLRSGRQQLLRSGRQQRQLRHE